MIMSDRSPRLVDANHRLEGDEDLELASFKSSLQVIIDAINKGKMDDTLAEGPHFVAESVRSDSPEALGNRLLIIRAELARHSSGIFAPDSNGKLGRTILSGLTYAGAPYLGAQYPELDPSWTASTEVVPLTETVESRLEVLARENIPQAYALHFAQREPLE